MKKYKALYGILGFPVEHSLSPLMHNTAFDALDIEASYQLFSVGEDELDGFFQELHDQDNPIFGLNVTVPYKEKVLNYMDILTPLVKKIKAVNTIVISPQRKLIAYNTDAPGFMSHLAELQFQTAEKHVAIIGAGEGRTTRSSPSSSPALPSRSCTSTSSEPDSSLTRMSW